MPSLARIDATERAGLLTVSRYQLSFRLPESGPMFHSAATISFECRTPGASTFVDVRAAVVVSAELNGRPLDPASVVDGRLTLTDLAAVNELRVVAEMHYSNDGEGLHRHVDPADGKTYLYAMSFLDSAPRWFACFDQPDLKAIYDIEVDCPDEWIVLGNSPATRLESGHWRLATSQPLSTYFVTLAAGPYASVSAEHDGIPLGLHARASLAPHLHDEAEDLLRVTRDSFDAYHALFGVRYPFGEYHQVFVPDFNAGAMENPGCVTLRDQYIYRSRASTGQRVVRATTVAHEMGHMWFGDLVTMRWWDDLWLNESFAEYLAHRVCAGMDGYVGQLSWTDFGISRKDWGSVADQSPASHPVAGNGSATAAAALTDFDGISYAKGASALRQLAAHLGDEVFLTGLRDHITRHRFGNASLSDLLDAWTAAGAPDMPTWSEEWLQTAGLDTITGTLSDGRARIERRSPDLSRRPHTMTVAGFALDGTPTVRRPVTLIENSLEVPMDSVTAFVVPDAHDDTWAKLRFSSWDDVGQLLPQLSDSLTRTVLYNAVRDGVRSADLDPAQALAILLRSVAAEPEELVVASQLEWAVNELVAVYSRPDARAGRRAALAALATDLLDRAEAGSDQQLTAARALIRASDDVGLLSRWRSQDGLPDGLTLDVELRWSLVNRLAALGHLTEAEIDAELAADPSTAGVVYAAGARAIRPDPVAKERAWRALTEPTSLSAYELYGIARGFFEPSQQALVAQYLPRFFPEMAATTTFRTGFSLGLVTEYSYPVTMASPELVALGDATLARHDLGAGVRRAFLDRGDVVRRAVASQQSFG